VGQAAHDVLIERVRGGGELGIGSARLAETGPQRASIADEHSQGSRAAKVEETLAVRHVAVVVGHRERMRQIQTRARAMGREG
jgi:hypothetical protein